MPSGFHLVLVIGALLWLACAVFMLALCRAASLRPWWAEMLEEIEELPEAGPEVYPRDRPSQDDQP